MFVCMVNIKVDSGEWLMPLCVLYNAAYNSTFHCYISTLTSRSPRLSRWYPPSFIRISAVLSLMWIFSAKEVHRTIKLLLTNQIARALT